jgi:hypothetical protein
VKDLLSNVGAGGGAPAVGAPAAGGGGAAAAAEAPAEEKKEEEKEESDDDMVSISLQVYSRYAEDAYQNVRALVSSTDLWGRIISFTSPSPCPCIPHQCAVFLPYITRT